MEAYVSKLPIYAMLTLPVAVERMERKSRPQGAKQVSAG